MRKWLAAVVVSMTLLNTTQGQDLKRELDSIVTHWTGLAKFSGTVMVSQHGKELLHKGYGLISHHQEKTPDENTLYVTGELTEMFTAMLIFRLEEEGKLSTNDTLAKYLPELPFSKKVTIGQMLSHTSGIHDYMNDDSLFVQGITSPRERKDIIGIIAARPLVFEPGTKYGPSASDYYLLGMVAEKVAGSTYYEAIRKYVIDPLRMENTGFDYGRFASWDKSLGYNVLNYQRMLPAFPIDSTVSFASGGLFTGTKGMNKLATAMLGNKVLKKATWQKMLTPQSDSFAYGFDVKQLAGKRTIGRTGESYGYVHCFYVIPEDSTVIAIMSNDFESEVFYMLDCITAALYGQPYKLPKPRSSVFLEEARLRHYEGRYEFEDGTDLNVYSKDKLLWGKMPGGPEFTLLADVIPDEFFMSSVGVEFRFIRNRKTNEVTHIIMRQNRRERVGNKWQ